MPAGHIYILLNPTMPGYLKIGMTTRTPEERACEISQATGVVVPYSVAYAEAVVDCLKAENLIHTRLAKFRVNRGREFFHLPLRDAIRVMSEIAVEVGRPEVLDHEQVSSQAPANDVGGSDIFVTESVPAASATMLPTATPASMSDVTGEAVFGQEEPVVVTGVSDWPRMAQVVNEVAARLQKEYEVAGIPGDVLKREIERRGGYRRDSVLPSDYCYNAINRASYSFRHHLLLLIGRSVYKYVGPGFRYSGPIMWKPKDGKEEQVGNWVAGTCQLERDPRR